MKKILFLSTLVCALTFNAFCQENEQKDPIKIKNENVANIKLGCELAQYGYANKSAMALIEAAQILASVPTTELKVEKEERGLEAKADPKQPKLDFNPVALLADAKKFAEGNTTLLTFIDQTEKAIKEATSQATVNPKRGDSDIPGTRYQVIAGKSYVTYYFNCVGGYTAECAVVGSGNTDIDLYVYDSNGNLIVKDEGPTDVCYAAWVPRWNGTFLIKIVNRGSYSNQCAIASNY